MKKQEYLKLEFEKHPRRILYLPGNYPGKFRHSINHIFWRLEDFKIAIRKVSINNLLPKKKDTKQYREDLNLWEERNNFLFLIPFYKYSIFRDGKVRTSFSLFKKSKLSTKYLKCTELPLVSVDAKEFAEKYQNNKWLIPINKKLKLS